MDSNESDRPERRSALVAHELAKCSIDIAALSETRLPGEGQLQELGPKYTFFWRGLQQTERRIHGVGFAIRNSFLKNLASLPCGISERLMTLRLKLTKNDYATVISAYAPTLDSEEAVKDAFYESLDAVLTETPKSDKIILLGDFNARVGRDNRLWGGVIGKNGLGNVNANGVRLLSLCAEHGLTITNTLFRQLNKYKGSWQHPRSKHWHLIDYVIVRAEDQKNVHLTRAVTGADGCWSDHRLIRSRMTLHMSRSSRSDNNSQRKRFNLAALEDPSVVEDLQASINNSLRCITTDDSVEAHWDKIKSSIDSSCALVLGYTRRKHKDWFDDNNVQITDMVAKKRSAFVAWQADPSSQLKRDVHRKAKAEVQKLTRQLKNDWWKAEQRRSTGFVGAITQGPSLLQPRLCMMSGLPDPFP